MASVADSFMADLDELSDREDYPEVENAETENLEEDADDNVPDPKSLDLDSVSKLQKTQRYKDIMQKVEDALERGISDSNQGAILEDQEYQLVFDCNALSVDIDKEITIIHNFICDKFKLKHPLLESRVHHPIDYARVVRKIGNEMDLTLVDLKGILPSADIMWITMAESTTSGEPLSEDNLVNTIEACDRALNLDATKKVLLEFLKRRMGYIASNLAAIVGSAVASKLMSRAGGLEALAKMPACNVLLLGAKKTNLSGFSTASTQSRIGYLEQTEVFQCTPPSLRPQASRLLAAKATLAAMIDSIRGDPTGTAGQNLLKEISKKIEKRQQLPPARLPKPLPIPDSMPKKKRGGCRLRKMKGRNSIVQICTDQHDEACESDEVWRARGVEESTLGDGLGKGYGLLGQAGSGKIRVSAGQSKLSTKIAKRFKEKSSKSSGSRLGLTSSFAFTPVQGI